MFNLLPVFIAATLAPTPLQLQSGKVSIKGDVAAGAVIPLGWAQSSAVACFPGNHFDAFSGKHVLYRFDLPAKSIATITLKGSDPRRDVNLYVYRAAPGETLIPPDINGTQCEASYGTAVIGTKPNPREPEKVEMWAIGNPYTIYVGVAGYKGVEAAGFELSVDVKSAPPPKPGKITAATPIAVKPGVTTVNGKIDGGVEIDLDWAQNSAVACFPGNHFDAFGGKHVLYRFDLPAKSIAKIALKGKDGSKDVNLYTYRAAKGDNNLLPPNIPGTQCEASYGWAKIGTKPNPGEVDKTEMWAIANPYTIYVGVAGYKGVTAADFELSIDLSTAPPPKTGKLTAATPITVKPGVTTVSGKIDGGVEIDLDWAQGSAVACFPGNHFPAFDGKHVLYRFDLPARSTARVSLKPKGKGDLNLYTYRAGLGETLIPPNIPGTQCEASYKMGRMMGVEPNPGEIEYTEHVAIANPYTIYVGVAGFKGVTEGDFELSVDLKTAPPPKTGKVTGFTPIAVKPGVTTVTGTIDSGVELDLDWAQRSDVACFPGTHFDAFSGKHVLYRFDLPAKSTANIKLTPKSGQDVNLYAYRVGVGETMLPPAMTGTQCEADHGQAVIGTKPNPGETDEVRMVAIANPYSVFVGVAGYKGVTQGAPFELSIALETAAPPKTGKVTTFTQLDVKPGVNKFEGKIDGGVEIDLDWAQRSDVACFPGNHFDAFSGKHVLYRFDQPAKATAKISLTAKNGKDVNLYAYRVGLGDKMLPPQMYPTQCEADYGQAVIGTKPNPGEVDEVEFVTIQNPYTVFVGVAGYKDVTSADFTLGVDLKVAPPEKTGAIGKYTEIPVTVDKTVTLQGSIDGGVEIPLGWAESSNVACWGGHRNVHFEGNHVLYRFEQPPNTSLAVKLSPKDPKLDLSLYVYRTSVGDKESLPPKVYMASCEASFGNSDALVTPNPGGVESVDHMITIGSPYTVWVGVAGARGVTAGAYSLDVSLKTR